MNRFDPNQGLRKTRQIQQCFAELTGLEGCLVQVESKTAKTRLRITLPNRQEVKCIVHWQPDFKEKGVRQFSVNPPARNPTVDSVRWWLTNYVLIGFLGGEEVSQSNRGWVIRGCDLKENQVSLNPHETNTHRAVVHISEAVPILDLKEGVIGIVGNLPSLREAIQAAFGMRA